MLVVRVGSALHRACVAADERRKKDKKEKFALTAGRVYRTVSGGYAVFLGFINTVNVNLKLTKEQKSIAGVLHHHSSYNELHSPLPDNWQDIGLTYTPWNMATMWMETYWYDKNQTAKKMQEEMQKQVDQLRDSGHWYSVKILRAHGYIEEIRGVDCELPVDLFEKARRVGLRGIQEVIDRRKESKAPYSIAGRPINSFEINCRVFGYDTQKTKEYNTANAEAHKKAWVLYRDVAEAQAILEHSTFANSIVFGMQPIINEHIEKIIKKFKKA